MELHTHQFAPTGGLNKDKKSNVPDGDYIDALNMVFHAGPEGKANAIKKMGGLSRLLPSYVKPFTYDGDLKIVDIEIDYDDRRIFILARDDTYAWIWEYQLG